jgi:CubicO group peptidase (beta-lactamase class C family)
MQIRIASCWLAAALVWGCSSSAPPASPAIAPATPAAVTALAPVAPATPAEALVDASKVDAAVAVEMSRNPIVGMSVAIAVDDKIVFAKGYGFTDLVSHEPVTVDSPFRLASISKTLTAVAAMQLAEQGALELDAPVQTYVPSFPQKPWPVTSRELLAHTSGIRHYASTAEILSTKHYTDIVSPLEIFENDPLKFEPGTKFAYSSYGYNLLGAIIAAAAHEPFVDRVRHRVLEPAGMKHAAAEDSPNIAHATGYFVGVGDERLPVPFYDVSNKLPSGGYVATASDLAELAIALETGKLLKPETRDAMWTPQHTRDGEVIKLGHSGYGLGFELGHLQLAGADTVFHTGGQPGVGDVMMIVPSEHVVVVALTSNWTKDIQVLAENLAADVISRKPH